MIIKNENGIITRYLTDALNPTGYEQVMEELNGGYGVVKRYTYGHDLISQTEEIAGNTYYYGYDGTGSVRLLFDSAGSIVAEYEYDAFGNVLSKTGGVDNSYMFHGEWMDKDLGLYYLRARWYSPEIGRFMSMDEFERNTEQPISLNKYLSFNEDPVNKQDPSGYWYTVGMMITFEVGGILANHPTVFLFDERGKIIERIVMRRKHINLEREDQWGHWWVEIGRKPNIEESYGWWPKEFISNLSGLVLGIEGELNGVTKHGGQPTHDPHEGEIGDENFNPRLDKKSKYKNTDEVIQAIRNFANNYSGKWSWPLGQNCHSFQIEMMKEVGLKKPLGGY